MLYSQNILSNIRRMCFSDITSILPLNKDFHFSFDKLGKRRENAGARESIGKTIYTQHPATGIRRRPIPQSISLRQDGRIKKPPHPAVSPPPILHAQTSEILGVGAVTTRQKGPIPIQTSQVCAGRRQRRRRRRRLQTIKHIHARTLTTGSACRSPPADYSWLGGTFACCTWHLVDDAQAS